MKAILLNGSQANDTTGERVCAATMSELRSGGWEIEHILLRKRKIGNCAGDFFCWIRNPGVCNIDDDNRDIAKAIVHADLVVYLTPVTFGGYSSALKRMVDHQIQNISPFFAQVNGETHHQKRYAKYPDFLAIGWQDVPDAQSEAVFRYLTQRNAINFYAKTAVTGLVLTSQIDKEISRSVHGWLGDLQKGRSSKPASLPGNPATNWEINPIRRALLLVGSPRTRKSSSYSLGGYLFEQLGTHNIQTETIFIHTSLRSPERMRALLKAVDEADLVMLAFPLYVDSLPAPVIEALERIAAHRSSQESTRRQSFAAIVNCGFPEAHHNAAAQAVCETFARQAGFDWAGSLALGAGQGLVNGTPLAELDGRAISIKSSLEMAAEALANGNCIQRGAVALMARPVIPGWLYRLSGIYGWRQQAKRYGMVKFLKRRPYFDATAKLKAAGRDRSAV